MLQWRFYWHLPYVAGSKEYLTNRLIIFVIIYQCCGSESDWITEYIQQYDNAMSKYLSRSDRVENSAAAFSPFNGHIKTAEQRNIIQQYVIGTQAVDWWAVTFGTEKRAGWSVDPPSPLLAVPNVTVHPSTASVPTSYYSMWHHNYICTVKG